MSGRSLVIICYMPTHIVSKDMKAQIPILFYQQGFNIKEICGLFDLKKTLVYRTLSYIRIYDVLFNSHAYRPGHKCMLSQGNLKFLVVLLNYRHIVAYISMRSRNDFVVYTGSLSRLQHYCVPYATYTISAKKSLPPH
jgi:hypothetical protein